jgi:hypothetical protein
LEIFNATGLGNFYGYRIVKYLLQQDFEILISTGLGNYDGFRIMKF